MNPTTKLEELNITKLVKEQEYKFTTYDTHLLMELLNEGAKSCCVFQAHGYAEEYLK